MEWIGDQDAFDRAAVETPSLMAIAQALRSVPLGRWVVTERHIGVQLEAVHRARAGLLEDKKRVLREEGEARTPDDD
jgi:hypothetical protein